MEMKVQQWLLFQTNSPEQEVFSSMGPVMADLVHNCSEQGALSLMGLVQVSFLHK